MVANKNEIELEMFLILKQASFFGAAFDEFKRTGKTDHLEELGFGQFRNVYDLGDHVLKVAHGTPTKPKETFKFHRDPHVFQKLQISTKDTGKHVNKEEANPEMVRDFPEMLIRTFEFAPDYSWIVQEKVRQATKEDVKEITGLSDLQLMEQVEAALYEMGMPTFQVGDYSEEKIDYKKMKEFPDIVKKMALLCTKYGVEFEDLAAKNLGIVERDGKKQLVLFDTGRHSTSKYWEEISKLT